MTDKTKKNIIKILAAVVITVVYFPIACWTGNIIALVLLPISSAFVDGNDVLTWVFFSAPSVLLFTFIDNLLFEPLYKLFERPILVYAVLSGNFMTLCGIFAMINGFSSSYLGLSFFSYLGAIFLVIPITSLLCGVLFCFLIRLFKSRKAKGISDSESSKEYAKWKEF